MAASYRQARTNAVNYGKSLRSSTKWLPRSHNPQGFNFSRQSTHKKFFRVYVNDTGKKAMLSHVPSQFPVGSVIIKEKLSSVTSKTPELLTVMIKRHPGYHKEWGDWEYLVVNGAATKVEASRTFEHCYGCHAVKKSNDYVFRDYETA